MLQYQIYKMKINVINKHKVDNYCQDIEDTSNEINENLNKIEQLIEALMTTFDEKENKKICEYIKNKKLIDLKKRCVHILNLKAVLQNMNEAYMALDEDFSTKIL